MVGSQEGRKSSGSAAIEPAASGGASSYGRVRDLDGGSWVVCSQVLTVIVAMKVSTMKV